MQMNIENLSKLMERVIAGEEVIIDSCEGKPIAKLIPYSEPPANKPRRGGQWKGRVKIADDFDQLPKDIAEAFGMER